MAKIEKELPMRLKLLSESTEPTGIISNTDNPEPKRPKPTQEIDDPSRANPLIDRVEPMSIKSKSDKDEPMRATR